MHKREIPVVFIIGPYEGEHTWEVELQTRAAEEVAVRLWAHRFAVVCTQTSCRFIRTALPNLHLLNGQLELLTRSDCAYVLPEWECSPTALNMLEKAHDINLPIFYKMDDILRWKQENE